MPSEQSDYIEGFVDTSVIAVTVDGIWGHAKNTSSTDASELLFDVHECLDSLASSHGAFRFRSVGGFFLSAIGRRARIADHAIASADLALEALARFEEMKSNISVNLDLKIGLASGEVIAGPCRRNPLEMEVYGQTVRVAFNMQRSAIPGTIQTSENLQSLISDRYVLKERGVFYVEDEGEVRTYLLTGRL